MALSLVFAFDSDRIFVHFIDWAKCDWSEIDSIITGENHTSILQALTTM